jgi:hypothetical protein
MVHLIFLFSHWSHSPDFVNNFLFGLFRAEHCSFGFDHVADIVEGDGGSLQAAHRALELRRTRCHFGVRPKEARTFDFCFLYWVLSADNKAFERLFSGWSAGLI